MDGLLTFMSRVLCSPLICQQMSPTKAANQDYMKNMTHFTEDQISTRYWPWNLAELWGVVPLLKPSSQANN